MFTLATSCLATSNLPWFMDLIFQVPIQYGSLWHQTYFHHQSYPQLGIVFCFGSIPSFFLELFLHWSPVAYWAPTNLESSSFSVLSFCLFILFMWFSREEYWSGLPFPSPSWRRVMPENALVRGKHPLPTTQEKTLHMDISRWSIPKSDWLWLFAAKYGEALYSQQKQDRKLTVVQIMNPLLPNSDLTWKK